MRSIEATELGIFTTVAVLLALVMKFRKRQTIPDRPGLQHPPMIPSIPILGSLPFIPDYSGFHEFFAKKSETMGPVIGFYMAQEYAVVVSGKEAIFDALVRKTDMAGRPELFTKLKYFNRRFKGFAEHMYDEEFKKYHPLVVNILREFGFGKRIMETRIRQEVDIVVNNIRAYQGREFDPYEIVTTGVFNVISSILFNKRYEHGDPDLRRILELELLWFTEYYDFMIVDTFRALLKLPSYQRKLEENLTHKNELMHWIHRAVIDAAYNRNEGDSFVTCFLQRQESNSYDYEQLAFVVRDLILGGTDTSSTSVRYFIIMMANNPEVQDKLQQEIDTVIGFDREVTLDDERNLPYTRATILELMRRNTLVALALPHEAMKDTTILNYFIPEGTRVIVNLYSTHMDPTLWTDPEKFRPERFLDSSGNVVDKEKVIPFSMGKRSCTGEQLARQEVFLHCASLAHHFRILPPEGQDIISVTENVSLVTTPSPFKARLIPRDVKLQ